MRILIDIGHPAHVHYFKIFIREMKKKGHHIKVSARNKEVIHFLLMKYNIPYKSRGKGSSFIVGKLVYLFYADVCLLINSIRFKPDLFLSFASPYAAHVSWLLGKPHIVLDDTESAGLNHTLYKPFSDVILNPIGFKKNLGQKQLFFNSFMELCYLHPKYFKPDINVLNELHLYPDDKYVILRFVSWQANHDIGKNGLSMIQKEKIVELLLDLGYKVFISSEGKMSDHLVKYKLDISPEKLHDVLSFASMYIGEGATTASESVMLGVPAIYINPLIASTTNEQQERGLLFQIQPEETLFQNLSVLIQRIQDSKNSNNYKEKLLREKIDMTGFLIWFISNYPTSFKTMKSNPDFQNRFIEQ